MEEKCMKAKIISYSHSKDVEDLFNEWVQCTRPDIIGVPSCTITVDEDGYLYYSITIFYYEREKEETHEASGSGTATL